MTEINLVDEAQQVNEPPAPASTLVRGASPSQFYARIRAYVGDMAPSACTPMDAALWKKQGLASKDAADRPVAYAFKYAGSAAVRAVFDRVVRVMEGRKIKEYDGVWLKVGLATTDLGAGHKGTKDVALDPPQPLLPRLATRANADPTLPLHITDREDAAIAIAASGGAVIGVASGATLFANSEVVDAFAPDLPRPLHPVCDELPLGLRKLVFIFEDRTAAVNAARGLRQGQAHEGDVHFLPTSRFLAQIDSAISQSITGKALHEYTNEAATDYQELLNAAIDSGNPGSIGMRVPLHMLQCLPAEVRDLVWPVTEGGGSSWDNLDWGLTRTGAVNGLFRDVKGDEFALNKPALTLQTPIYITRRAVMDEGVGEDHVELMWAEQSQYGYQRKTLMLPSQHVFGGAGRELLRAGVPIADARRAAQWFNAFRAANPKLPTTHVYDRAGWVKTEHGHHFLLPESGIEGHEMQRGVLTGVTRQGSSKAHWKLTQDFYEACDPINQILLVAPHASLLLAALHTPGCVLGLVDETSSGKSVFLQTAARQYGWDGGDFAFDASNPPTAAFLERVVYRNNGLCVLIDEFHKFPNTRREAQGNSYTRQEAAYFLSNGQRRGRSNATGGIDTSTERVYCYSIVAGEARYITALDSASQMEGARVRMITLPLVGYSKTFLETYGGLPRYMSQLREVKGHIGYTVADALAAEVNHRPLDELRAEVDEITAKLRGVFAEHGATDNMSQRRATFLAPILYTELLLGRAFPGRMWATTFEATCVARALAGKHRELLMRIDSPEKARRDEVTAADTVLEALRRDPTLIQGLRDEEKTNPHPLGRVTQRRRSTMYGGLSLYPKAVFAMLARHGIVDTAARELLTKSGDFVLQNGDRLLHRSNGEQWLKPVAGWGWDLFYAPPGDVAGEANDPYHEPRKAFLRMFEELSKTLEPLPALHAAIDQQMAQARAESRPEAGTLPSQLVAKYEPAWRALTDPLLDRLAEKAGYTDMGDTVCEYLARMT